VLHTAGAIGFDVRGCRSAGRRGALVVVDAVLAGWLSRRYLDAIAFSFETQRCLVGLAAW
jgi:hypothetical protein